MTFMNMAAAGYVFICLCLSSFVNSEVFQKNVFDSHSSEIAAVLNHLNASPFKVYDYKQATLLNAQKKADITELVLDIEVDCINQYPDVPCNEKVVTCNAFVRNTPEGQSQVLTNVDCRPKPEIIIEEPAYESSTNLNVEATEPKSIALSNEAVSSEVGDHFVAVRKDFHICTGCLTDLNPKAKGVDELIDLALEHIETERPNKHALVKVLKLQRQVVNGFKYYLTAEFAPTTCEKQANFDSCPVDLQAILTCEIIYLQRIGQSKHIVKNTCTTTQKYVKTEPKKQEISNEVNGDSNPTDRKPNFDHIAESGAVETMTPARLAALESQIIFDDSFPKPPIFKSQEAPISQDKIGGIVSSTAESNQVGSIAFSASTESEQSSSDFVKSTQADQAPTTAELTSVDPTAMIESSTTELAPKNDSSEESKSSENRDSSEEKPRQKRAIRQLEKISPDEKGLVKNLADFAANTLDNMDDDNHKRVILQILGAKKMVGDDGVYYHLIMRMGISKCLEDTPPNPYENCRDKLFENYTKICKVQVFVNDDFGSRKVVKSQCQNIKRDKNDSNRTNYSRFRRETLVGGQNQIDKNSENIRQFIREGLTHLTARLNKSNKLKPVEVISATGQVVAGSLYRVKIKIAESDCLKDDAKDLEDCHALEGTEPKTCEMKVWDKPWQNFRQFTFTCEGETNDHQFVTNPKSRSKRQVGTLGGVTQVSEDDEFVAKYLEVGLDKLDSESNERNKFKVHEFISATSQVVSGHIYRIKARVVLSDCKKDVDTKRGQCGLLEGAKPKTCNFEVFEQLWKPNSRKVKVQCELTAEFETKTHRNKRQTKQKRNEGVVPGGQSEVSENDEFVKKYLEVGLKHLDSKSSHENKLKLHEVLSATSQVVAGHIYRIKAKVILSDCKKTTSTNRDRCGILEGAKPKTCDFEVFEQLWVPKSRTTDITCGDETYHFRAKRSPESSGFLGKNDQKVFFDLFTQFIEQHNKTYAKKEFKHRFKIFRDNMLKIRLLNTYEQGTATYGVTKFADLTEKEFSNSLGLRTELRNENETPFAQAHIPDLELPTEFDWRKKGAVSEVKDQGQCGSCWAFSVTGNVEGQYAIKHGKLLEFSEQELVDCDTEDQGCNGGLMDTAYRQIEKMGGLETEQDYPYDAEGEKCHFNRTLAKVQLTGALNISHNETDMAKWLVANGPISIAINANAMQFYMGGVSHPFKFLCDPKNLDHGVLIVGYGVHSYPLFKKSLPYWIVKNSWGSGWGEQGYYRVFRGDGTCGVNQLASSAIVA